MEDQRIAFDSDVLIYSAASDHPLGPPVFRLLERASVGTVLLGSTLLIPELLIKPTRLASTHEQQALVDRLSRLTLLPLDESIAELAAALGAEYGLKPVDSVHLATAVNASADRFITNNRKDFDQDRVVELEVIYPEQLT